LSYGAASSSYYAGAKTARPMASYVEFIDGVCYEPVSETYFVDSSAVHEFSRKPEKYTYIGKFTIEEDRYGPLPGRIYFVKM
jgi:hypothetical protein